MRLSRERRTRAVLLLSSSLASLSVSPAIAGRLPTDVVPTSQAIHLRLDADKPDYSGSVRVDLEVRQPTRTIQLNSDGQKLEQVTLWQKGKAIPVAHEPGERGLLTLTAERPLARGAATLEIRFSHAFNTQAVSLYRMEKEGQGYLFTQFEAEHARQAFPCWDEPSFKIPYQMTLEVPEASQALFNTPIERQTVASGWRTLVFKKTPPLPSYLLAIATGPLEFTPIPGTAPRRCRKKLPPCHVRAAIAPTAPSFVTSNSAYPA